MPFSKPLVVIDNGSYNIKAGFACDNHPVSIFRNTVGRPKFLQGTYGKTPYEVYVGEEAVAQIDDLDLNYPVIKGRITHWDNMERVWHHIYYRELKAAPEDRAVLLSCSPSTTVKDKIKCCEVFFEALNAPALTVKPQSVLAVCGSGYVTGLSVDLGHHITEINPVYEGGAISYANMLSNVTGHHVSCFIKDLFDKRELNFGLNTDNIISDLRKKYIYVTKNSAGQRQGYRKKYKLPSGEEIDVGDEAFLAGEMYFQPDLVTGEKMEGVTIQDAIVIAVLKCETELQNEMYDAVVTHGGMASMPGLNKRLRQELEPMINRHVNILETTESYAKAWLGGAVFAGTEEARRVWVLKKQFEEQGERIVRNRF